MPITPHAVIRAVQQGCETKASQIEVAQIDAIIRNNSRLCRRRVLCQGASWQRAAAEKDNPDKDRLAPPWTHPATLSQISGPHLSNRKNASFVCPAPTRLGL